MEWYYQCLHCGTKIPHNGLCNNCSFKATPESVKIRRMIELKERALMQPKSIDDIEIGTTFLYSFSQMVGVVDFEGHKIASDAYAIRKIMSDGTWFDDEWEIITRDQFKKEPVILDWFDLTLPNPDFNLWKKVNLTQPNTCTKETCPDILNGHSPGCSYYRG